MDHHEFKDILYTLGSWPLRVLLWHRLIQTLIGPHWRSFTANKEKPYGISRNTSSRQTYSTLFFSLNLSKCRVCALSGSPCGWGGECRRLICVCVCDILIMQWRGASVRNINTVLVIILPPATTTTIKPPGSKNILPSCSVSFFRIHLFGVLYKLNLISHIWQYGYIYRDIMCFSNL